MNKIAINDFKSINDVVSMAKDKEVFQFDFLIPKDRVRNANKLGYAKTPRAQNFLNFKQNDNKRFLVELGTKASEEYDSDKMHKAIAIVEIANLTEHRFDPDNLQVTYKDICDGLVSGGVLDDDNGNVIISTVFKPLEEEKDRDNYKMKISLIKIA